MPKPGQATHLFGVLFDPFENVENSPILDGEADDDTLQQLHEYIQEIMACIREKARTIGLRNMHFKVKHAKQFPRSLSANIVLYGEKNMREGKVEEFQRELRMMIRCILMQYAVDIHREEE